MLLRPASFFAAAGGRASYAGPIIYALACHVIAVLVAGAYDLTFASIAGTLNALFASGYLSVLLGVFLGSLCTQVLGWAVGTVLFLSLARPSCSS